MSLESVGVPSVFVASDEFIGAALVQAEALGMPDVRRVFVPHPIQDRTDEEMRAIAEAAAAEVLEALTS